MKHMSKILLSSRGASAIILSVMVSGSVLATIFYNQQSMQWALSTQASHQEEWSHDFIKKYGTILGAYLVSNNLILCKEKGWSDDKNAPLCKWNNLPKPTTEEENPTENQNNLQPSDFNLSAESIKVINGTQVLKFTARLQEDTINVGKEVVFDITFDLVNWKNSAIKSLIGDIPNSICRDTATYRLKPEGYCPSLTSSDTSLHKPCKESADPSARNIHNSRCEFIAPVDQDYHIVLVTVQLEGGELEDLAYSGIRRPLSYLAVTMNERPECSQACLSPATPNDHPGCRGDFQPVSGDSQTSFNVKVTNKGPGVLYRLSLLRTDTYLHEDGTPKPPPKYIIIEDVLRRAKEGAKKALLPGQSITFQDTLECKDTTRYMFSKQRQTRYDSEPSTRVFSNAEANRHVKPFVSLAYTVRGLSTGPAQICVKQQEGRLEWKNEESCTSKQKGQACGTEGVCNPPPVIMEPARGLFEGQPLQVDKTDTVTNTVTTVLTVIRPPH